MKLYALAIFTLLVTASATPVERADYHPERDADANPNPNPEAEMPTLLEPRAPKGCPKSSPKRCVKDGKCLPYTFKCCPGSNGLSYCPFGYSCANNGKKCQLLGAPGNLMKSDAKDSRGP